MILTICVFFLPESPRFLIVKNKLDKANEILNKIKKTNNSQSVHPVYKEEKEMCVSKSSLNIMNENSKQESNDQKLFKKEYSVMKIFLLVLIWFALNMSYYGVGLGTIKFYYFKTR